MYFCTKIICNDMNKTIKLLFLTALGVMTIGCTTHYQLTSISRQRILIDNRYDRQPDAAAAAFIAPYHQKVDSVMSPVMGIAARDMDKRQPESEISNLLSDILVWASKDYGEKPDFGVYNIGGIRAALSKGPVTYGDINDIAPFENKIAFVTLTGEKVTELFQQIAKRGGEGVSHGVELVITKDGQLLSARLNGKEIDPKGKYRAVTIDYLAQGNDGMPAFKDGTNLVSPQNELDNSRFIIMNYFKAMHAQGKEVDAQVEGRITISDLNDK
jgi:2',3'-cyclic-nucleotide 2'-phosphodiesterase (5'-nucleotidase family)